MASQVSGRPKLLLMTDYDGTLVPIRERPEYALPGPGLLSLLRRLANTSRVALAVISGRDADDLKKLIPVKGIYLAGCHGAEILFPGGERHTAVEIDKLSPVLEAVAAQARKCVSGREGFLVEKKRAAVALHYRMAGRTAALKALDGFETAVRPLAMEHGLEFVAGRMVLEVRPRGVNKGETVRRLMNLHPCCCPLYFGDDTTDEDAFRAVRENGLGVLVSGRGPVTAASHRLTGPHEVLRFLQIISA